MRRARRLLSERSGVSAVEMALVLPIAMIAIVGIAQLGILYFAHAGLRSLVAEGARYASISPRPTQAAIRSRLQQGGFGLASERLATPSITYGSQGGAAFADIQLSYSVPLNFIFWSPEPVQLTERRRVFLYPET